MARNVVKEWFTSRFDGRRRGRKLNDDGKSKRIKAKKVWEDFISLVGSKKVADKVEVDSNQLNALLSIFTTEVEELTEELRIENEKEPKDDVRIAELKDELEVAKDNLERVKEDIEAFKAAKKVAEDEKIEEAFKKVKAAYEKLENDSIKRMNESIVPSLISALTKAPISLSEVNVAINNLNGIYTEYKKQLGDFEAKAENYKKVTGRDFDKKPTSIKLTEEQVEKILKAAIECRAKAKSNKQEQSLDWLIGFLPEVLEEGKDFEEIKARVTGRTMTDEEECKKEIAELIETKYLEMLKNSIAKVDVKNYDKTQTEFVTEMSAIIAKYPKLSKMEDELKKYGHAELISKTEEVFGQENMDTVYDLFDIYEAIEELGKIEYTSSAFKTEYTKLVEMILDFQTNTDTNNKNAIVVFDEETQELRVEFKDKKINAQIKGVVSKEILEKMKKELSTEAETEVETEVETEMETEASTELETEAETEMETEASTELETEAETEMETEASTELETEAETEVETEPSLDDDKKAAINEYIARLNEANEMTNFINEHNARILVSAVQIDSAIDTAFPLNPNTVDKVNGILGIEKDIQNLDTALLQSKTSLMKMRTDFKLKFGVFINSIKEVKEFPKETVKLEGSLDSFLSLYDKMIIRAELKIMDLYDEKTRDTTSIERKNELDRVIQSLGSYIETLNAVINRRLVAESVENNLDLVECLTTRRKNKNERREQMKKDWENRKKNHDETLLEQELREKLDRVYGDWIKDLEEMLIHGGTPVDEASYNQRINDILNDPKYQITNKDKIAEEARKAFEASKNALEKNAKDIENLNRAVIEVLHEDLIKIITSLRENPTTPYAINKISDEAKAKIDVIKSGSEVADKENIINGLITTHLSKLNEVIGIEQIHERANFQHTLSKSLNEIEALEINDEFEGKVVNILNALKNSFLNLTGLDITWNFSLNSVTYGYKYKEVNLTNGAVMDRDLLKNVVMMSVEKAAAYQEYLEKKKNPDTEPEPEPDTEPIYAQNANPILITEFEILLVATTIANNPTIDSLEEIKNITLKRAKELGMNISEKKFDQIIGILEYARGFIAVAEDKKNFERKMSLAEYDKVIPEFVTPQVQAYSEHNAKVYKTRELEFAPGNGLKIHTGNGFVLEANVLRLQLLERGLQVHYSKTLREQLKAINAKLSLVNKKSSRTRTTLDFNNLRDDQQENATLAFREDPTVNKKQEAFNPEDYRLELRTTSLDESGKKDSMTTILGQIDLADADGALLEDLREEQHIRTR